MSKVVASNLKNFLKNTICHEVRLLERRPPKISKTCSLESDKKYEMQCLMESLLARYLK